MQVADLLARGLEERTGQAPLQMDVFQGKEPAHFLSLFNSAMVHGPAERPVHSTVGVAGMPTEQAAAETATTDRTGRNRPTAS
jgi:hypothetical protein